MVLVTFIFSGYFQGRGKAKNVRPCFLHVLKGTASNDEYPEHWQRITPDTPGKMRSSSDTWKAVAQMVLQKTWDWCTITHNHIIIFPCPTVWISSSKTSGEYPLLALQNLLARPLSVTKEVQMLWRLRSIGDLDQTTQMGRSDSPDHILPFLELKTNSR